MKTTRNPKRSPRTPKPQQELKKTQLRTPEHDQQPQNPTRNPWKHPGIHGDPPGTPKPHQEPMENPKNPQRPPEPHGTPPTQWVTPKSLFPLQSFLKDPNSTQVSLNSTQVFLTFTLKFSRTFLTPTSPFLRQMSSFISQFQPGAYHRRSFFSSKLCLLRVWFTVCPLGSFYMDFGFVKSVVWAIIYPHSFVNLHKINIVNVFLRQLDCAPCINQCFSHKLKLIVDGAMFACGCFGFQKVEQQERKFVPTFTCGLPGVTSSGTLHQGRDSVIVRLILARPAVSSWGWGQCWNLGSQADKHLSGCLEKNQTLSEL